MLTTSSRASIESNPRPFGPKSGRSSPIWSGVVCSIKFLTSISLMRVRSSTSDIISGGEIVVIGQEVNCALSCRAKMPFGSDFRLDRPCRREWHLGSDRGGRRCLLERQFGQRSMLAADYLWLRRHCDQPYAAHP